MLILNKILLKMRYVRFCILFDEILKCYIILQVRQICLRRSQSHPHLTRLPSFRPSQGDIYYLRALLVVRPGYSFRELRTINGLEYPTFQDAAAAMGLFATESEAEHSLIEAITTLRTPHQLRFLFVQLLVNDCITQPMELWDRYKDHLGYDFYLQHSGNSDIAIEMTLQELSARVEEFGCSLKSFGLQEPMEFSNEVLHEMERWGTNSEELSAQVTTAYHSFTSEQQTIFDEFVQAINDNQSLCLFVDGKAGRGKSFLIQSIVDYVRSRGEVAVVTATSAFAALGYNGGRTTHSAFKVRYLLIFFLFLYMKNDLMAELLPGSSERKQ
jgi:PIF1-like helicase